VPTVFFPFLVKYSSASGQDDRDEGRIWRLSYTLLR